MKLIVFEGLDGAGKSTLIEALKTHLEKNRQSVVVTREPGGTVLGEELRHVLLNPKSEAPTPRAELLLYEAIRAQHVERVILPALKSKKWVLCDRFVASSIAFQAGGRSITKEKVEELNEFATEGLKPDLTVLLDLSTQEAQSRMAARDLDRFESEKKDFHERVRASYLEQARENREPWLVLDAKQSREELFVKLRSYFEEKKWL